MKNERAMALIVVVPPMILIALAAVRDANSAHPSPLWSVKYSPDGKSVTTTGGSSSPTDVSHPGELVVWDLEKGKEKFVIQCPSSIRSVAYTPDGRYLVAGAFDGAIRVISFETGRTVAAQDRGPALVNAVAFFSDSTTVLSGGFDGVISMWNFLTGNARQINLPGEKILNLAISRSDKLLVATARSGAVFT